MGSTTVSKGGGVTVHVENGDNKRGEDIIETFPHYDNIGALQQSALDGATSAPFSLL